MQRRILLVSLMASLAFAFPGTAHSWNSAGKVTVGPQAFEHRAGFARVLAAKIRALELQHQVLVVRGTPDGKTTHRARAFYFGWVAPGAQLTVNGVSVATSPRGFWFVKRQLSVGANTFAFAATGGVGVASSVVRHVTFDPAVKAAKVLGLRTAGKSCDGRHAGAFAEMWRRHHSRR